MQIISSKFLSVLATKTANYTAKVGEDVIPCNASGGAFTVTLPAASASLNGRVLRVLKVVSDTSLNQITITDGTLTTYASTFGETVTLAVIGGSWVVIERNYPKTPTAYTPTTDAFTPNSPNFLWSRNGSSVRIYGTCSIGSPNGGTMAIYLPTGLTIPSSPAGTKIYGSLAKDIANSGTWFLLGVASANKLTVSINSSGAFVSQLANAVFNPGDNIAIDANVPVSNWE